ncbi:MAG: DUF1844 domain-containing protein [Planctomycetota bacterium]
MADDDKPKIIIDEDWKSQVEAEKAAAKQTTGEPAASAAGAASASDPVADDSAAPTDALPEDPPMPPASFEMLLTTLATEAMMAMGQMPHPVTGESQVRRNQAKYLIDTIEVLKDKTAGNLSEPEAQATEGLLHQLRMAFVATK